MRLLIVLPAYNEQAIIERNVIKVYDFVKRNFSGIDWYIIVADNNSTDGTARITQRLANNYDQIDHLFVPQKGKGSAIRSAWERYDADVYVFMDADLATDLSALPALVDSVVKGGYDISCGSRYAKESIVQRSLLRKVTSYGYRFVLKIFLNLKTKDAPCGFKAISKKVRDELLPQVRDNEWFFDSELVILAEKGGYGIKEIPIVWHEPIEDGRKSKVNIVSLGVEYIKKVFEMRKRLHI